MIGHRLNSALTIYRASYASDGAGGRTEIVAQVGTIRGQVNQPTAQERLLAAQAGTNLTHVVHTTYGADVERGDKLDAGEPRRLRVLAVLTDSRHTYTRLECEVVQGE